MAVTVKDFKIKAGLIVEGTTGQINNFDILTKKQADQNYIIGLVGGSGTPENTPSTLVKRDENGDFSAGTVTVGRINFGTDGFIEGDGDGDIDIVATGDDVRITADDIRLSAIDDVILSAGDEGSVDGDVVLTTSGGNIRLDAEYVYVGSNEVDSERVATRGYVDQAETDAISAAESYTNTALEDYTPTADLDTTIDGYGYLKSADLAGYATESYVNTAEEDAIAAAALDATQKANDAQANAIAAAALDATEKANTAESNAESYTDSLIGDNTVDGTPGNTVTDRIATAVSNLVDSAPELLNTLGELAEALQDNPDVIGDLQDIAAGKQDILTAGANIEITGSTISVTDLDTDDVAEGSNLYFQDYRAVDAVANVLGTGIVFSAENAGNVFHIDESYLSTEITDGARSAISVEFGGTPLTYDSANGVIGIGIAASGGINLDGSNDLQVNRDVVNDWYEASGAVSTHNSETSAHGVGTVVGTTETQTLTNKSIDGAFNTITNIDNDSLVNSTIEINGNVTNLGSSVTLDTDDISEGENRLYFTDVRAVDAIQNTNPVFETVTIDSVAKQVASTLEAATSGVQTAYSWDKNDYRSAEFLVKVAYGSHTEISKVLLTLDTLDNISITEYGIVGTNGSASSISAGIDEDQVQLLVTTNNNNSTVTVVGTLLV